MSSTTKKFYDVIGAINKYEENEMDNEEVVELFQHLVDTGLAWKLQGSYGRMAIHMIEIGKVTEK